MIQCQEDFVRCTKTRAEALPKVAFPPFQGGAGGAAAGVLPCQAARAGTPGRGRNSNKM
ncbi:protein of unknown function [Cupriavidus taiwanensis]|uniref:Uncharacterized protein n=1 Tax=Cupriavidus taiwanensis TaxID=164546 RepID=A0A7Z7NM67_9BURK|nr:protein of unknown function [Cupriavidus taiwanensis]SOZ02220.1 hypothetical protein CBM2595_A31025 [Cupriavidus taiwanensis]SOZ05209.1 hypothetical protein CBM2597_A51161 [Cupriavidus taiwanensis]SPC09692.1 hypothetical protein CBM2594_A41015 [Cupriavidus taiwanensis]SPD39478.1 protein of unknown function [Cupriavidus taiwanensis]